MPINLENGSSVKWIHSKLIWLKFKHKRIVTLKYYMCILKLGVFRGSLRYIKSMGL